MNFFSYIFATAVLSILSHQTISEENVTQIAVLNRTVELAHNVTLPPLAVVKREVVQEDSPENVDQIDPASYDVDRPEPTYDDNMPETVAKRDVAQQKQQVPQKADNQTNPQKNVEENRVAVPQELANQTDPQANVSDASKWI